MVEVDVLVIDGGQSGLAAAHTAKAAGACPVVLEAGERPTGSWARYYDSLTLFSPARYSELRGLSFGGDPGRYPHRDEVVDYLARYAARIDVDIRTRHRVKAVAADGEGFQVTTTHGEVFSARTVVAATGGFGRPHRPALPGLDRFSGSVVHVADYRRPRGYAGQRVVVVGAGNSAVQVATELATAARTTLTSRASVKFSAQRPFGRDLHFWLTVTGLDIAPVGRLLPKHFTTPVLDTGVYRAAVASGLPDRRPLFTGIDGSTVTWADGTHETVDVIVLATGYRPDLGYLASLGALDADGWPLHRGGVSSSHTGLGYVGLEWQRSLSSATLRGVGRDAAHVIERMSKPGRGMRWFRVRGAWMSRVPG